MKAGFLSRPPRPTETPRQHAQEHAAPAPAQPASVAGTPAHQSGDSPAAPLQLSQEQWASNFAQCLELLRSPADETKFVGLLVAIKLLATSTTDDALRQVRDAVGWPFIQRLLLPLAVRPAQPLAREQEEQQCMLVSLGLSLLASLCRLPEVPASDEMQRLLPSLATVVSAGSVSAALRDPPISHPTSDQTTHTHAPTHPAPESPDWGALSDALECLLAAATNQSGPASSAACEQLLQLGLVGSVGRVLQGVLATSAQHRWQGVGADGRGGSPWRMMVMAVRLLSTLLATAPPQQATDKEPDVLVLLPALCHLIGLPEVLTSRAAAAAAASQRAQRREAQQQAHRALLEQDQARHAAAAAASTPAQPQLTAEQQQLQRELQGQLQDALNNALGQLQVKDTPPPHTTTTPTHPTDSHTNDTTHVPHTQQPSALPTQTEDPALLQIESLHALNTLLVRRPVAATGITQQQTGPSGMSGVTQGLAGLIACAEGGLGGVSVGEGVGGGYPSGWGAAARRGLGWVLRGGAALGEDVRHSALQVAAGLAGMVGSGWLLSSGGAGAPQSAQELATVIAETAQIELGLLLRDALYGAAPSQAPAVPDQTSAIAGHVPGERLMKELEARAREYEDSLPGQPPDTPPTLPPTAQADTSHGPTALSPAQSARASQRAVQRLPAVLTLLESLIEAVADQADGSDDTAKPTPTPTLSARGGPLPLATQQQLLMSLGASAQLVLDALQSVMADVQASDAQAAQDASTAHGAQGTGALSIGAGGQHSVTPQQHSATPSPEVSLACTRFLGHYYAEVPDAWGDATWAVLPLLLDPWAGTGEGGDGRGTREVDQLRDLAVDFLLPGLLQVCSMSPVQQRRAQQTFTRNPRSLSLVIAAWGRAADQATYAMNTIDDGIPNPQPLYPILEASERRLADTSMLLVHVLGTAFPSTTCPPAAAALHSDRSLRSACRDVALWASTRLSDVARECNSVKAGVEGVVVSGLMPRAILCTCAALSLASRVQGKEVNARGGAHITTAVWQGVSIGLALRVAQTMEEVQPGSAMSLLRPDTAVRHMVEAVLEDVAGDAEQCWQCLCESLDARADAGSEALSVLHAFARTCMAGDGVQQLAFQMVRDGSGSVLEGLLSV